MWGRLGRRGSRTLQLAMNTYYFLSRCLSLKHD
jgi:hypothetical protein